MELLHVARRQGMRWSGRSARSFAKGVQLEALQLEAGSQGYPWNRDTSASDAGDGRLEVLQRCKS